jgi:cytochrome P450
MMTMLVAGHETTAIILAWFWYVLSQNPTVEQKMISEIDDVLQGRVPTMADLPALSYTLMVLQETMRIYPPVGVTARQTVTEDEIAGYKIPARSVVTVCAYTTHRHPGFWQDPDCFDPGRFTPEKSRSRHRHAYFPFLSGRHLCIGQSFAITESQLIVAMLAQRLSIRPIPGQSIKPLLGVTLRMQDGMMVTAGKRTRWSGMFYLPSCTRIALRGGRCSHE